MLIVDRFEGEFAVVENIDDDTTMSIPIKMIDEGVSEGDVVCLVDGIYRADAEQTKKRRAEMLALMKDLGL